jgi:prolyl-tRNA editing enzyme YbaK/EbsC (Cys-tRNA(Pro) deacylase)
MAAATVAARLGVEVGGLGPFPITPGAIVIIDSEVSAWPVMRCGAGSRSRTVELRPADLVRAGLLRIARIARTAQGTGDAPTSAASPKRSVRRSVNSASSSA